MRQRLVETAMLAAVGGVAYTLATMLKLQSYLGYLQPMPVVVAAMRWGPAAARKATTATTFLLLGVLAYLLLLPTARVWGLLSPRERFRALEWPHIAAWWLSRAMLSGIAHVRCLLNMNDALLGHLKGRAEAPPLTLAPPASRKNLHSPCILACATTEQQWCCELCLV